jgi:hypothetical protein
MNLGQVLWDYRLLFGAVVFGVVFVWQLRRRRA